MDMITLAMAKAYTDEKVGEGGGSSGGFSLPVVELSVGPADYFNTDDRGGLPPEDCAKLDAVADIVMPIIVRFPHNSEQCALIMNRTMHDGHYHAFDTTGAFTGVWGTVYLDKEASGIWRFFATE